MSTPNESNPKVHTAADTVPAKLVMAVGVIAVVIGVGSVWVSSKILDATREDLGQPEDRTEVVTFTAPREIGLVDQTLVGSDRFGIRQKDEQRAELRAWHWLDEDEGTVQMPIDTAMDLWLKREGGQ